MDKFPALVKTTAFSIRKKNSFLFPHSHFPQHKIFASVKQSPLEARSPNTFSMFAQPWIFLHVFWHKQEVCLTPPASHLPVATSVHQSKIFRVLPPSFLLCDELSFFQNTFFSLDLSPSIYEFHSQTFLNVPFSLVHTEKFLTNKRNTDKLKWACMHVNKELK